MGRIFAGLARPWIRNELPGWGKVYSAFVGDYKSNDMWEGSLPVVIRDKTTGLLMLLAPDEWADRLSFYLGRWCDLEMTLIAQKYIKPGDRVLDVGANYGLFSLAASEATGASGTVIAFEPNPAAYKRLMLNFNLNNLGNVTAMQYGISDEPGELVLSIPSINSGEATFAESKYEDSVTVRCPVKTLDETMFDEKVDFIKIDVEGFECNVLRGATEILKRDAPLISTEVIDEHLECAGETRANLFGIFEQHGYVPFSVGLQKENGNQALRLTRADLSTVAMDFLWVPESRLDELGLTDS